jgi:hypothetical protein
VPKCELDPHESHGGGGLAGHADPSPAELPHRQVGEQQDALPSRGAHDARMAGGSPCPRVGGNPRGRAGRHRPGPRPRPRRARGPASDSAMGQGNAWKNGSTFRYGRCRPTRSISFHTLHDVVERVALHRHPPGVADHAEDLLLGASPAGLSAFAACAMRSSTRCPVDVVGAEIQRDRGRLLRPSSPSTPRCAGSCRGPAGRRRDHAQAPRRPRPAGAPASCRRSGRAGG